MAFRGEFERADEWFVDDRSCVIQLRIVSVRTVRTPKILDRKVEPSQLSFHQLTLRESHRGTPFHSEKISWRVVRAVGLHAR